MPVYSHYSTEGSTISDYETKDHDLIFSASAIKPLLVATGLLLIVENSEQSGENIDFSSVLESGLSVIKESADYTAFYRGIAQILGVNLEEVPQKIQEYITKFYLDTGKYPKVLDIDQEHYSQPFPQRLEQLLRIALKAQPILATYPIVITGSDTAKITGLNNFSQAFALGQVTTSILNRLRDIRIDLYSQILNNMTTSANDGKFHLGEYLLSSQDNQILRQKSFHYVRTGYYFGSVNDFFEALPFWIQMNDIILEPSDTSQEPNMTIKHAGQNFSGIATVSAIALKTEDPESAASRITDTVVLYKTILYNPPKEFSELSNDNQDQVILELIRQLSNKKDPISPTTITVTFEGKDLEFQTALYSL